MYLSDKGYGTKPPPRTQLNKFSLLILFVGIVLMLGLWFGTSVVSPRNISYYRYSTGDTIWVSTTVTNQNQETYGRDYVYSLDEVRGDLRSSNLYEVGDELIVKVEITGFSSAYYPILEPTGQVMSRFLYFYVPIITFLLGTFLFYTDKLKNEMKETGEEFGKIFESENIKQHWFSVLGGLLVVVCIFLGWYTDRYGYENFTGAGLFFSILETSFTTNETISRLFLFLFITLFLPLFLIPIGGFYFIVQSLRGKRAPRVSTYSIAFALLFFIPIFMISQLSGNFSVGYGLFAFVGGGSIMKWEDRKLEQQEIAEARRMWVERRRMREETPDSDYSGEYESRYGSTGYGSRHSNNYGVSRRGAYSQPSSYGGGYGSLGAASPQSPPAPQDPQFTAEQKNFARTYLPKMVTFRVPDHVDSDSPAEIFVKFNNNTSETLEEVSVDLSDLNEYFDVEGSVQLKRLRPGMELENYIKIHPKFSKGSFPVKIRVEGNGVKLALKKKIKVGGTEIY